MMTSMQIATVKLISFLIDSCPDNADDQILIDLLSGWRRVAYETGENIEVVLDVTADVVCKWPVLARRLLIEEGAL